MFLQRIKTLLIASLLLSFGKVNGQACNGPLMVSLAGSASGDSIEVSLEISGVTCSESDGSIVSFVSGGSPDWDFEWEDALTTDSVRNDIGIGTYILTVTDLNGCSKSIEGEVNTLMPSETELVMEDGCGVCQIEDGNSSYFYDDQKNYIASLTDEMGNPTELGNTEICVFVESSVQYCNSSPVLQRSWSVDPNEDTNACVKLFFTQNEFDNLASATTAGHSVDDLISNEYLCVTSYDGGMESCNDHGEKTTYPMGASPGADFKLEDPLKEIWSVSVCVDHFSTFTVGVCDAVLPVELIYFDGKKDDKVNILDWITATEVNTAHFDLQKSSDGENFVSLHIEEAAGNSSTTQQYSFIDEHPSNQKDYYRLKMVDLDGSYTFSEIVVLDRYQEFTNRLYPTLFKGKIYNDIYLPQADRINYRIIDAIGRVLATKTVDLPKGENTVDFNLEFYPPGTYFISLELEDQDFYKVYKAVKSENTK